MTVKITTEYSNVDQKWLDWYLKRLREQNMERIADELEASGRAFFTSKDPTSEVVGVTMYALEKP